MLDLLDLHAPRLAGSVVPQSSRWTTPAARLGTRRAGEPDSVGARDAAPSARGRRALLPWRGRQTGAGNLSNGRRDVAIPRRASRRSSTLG